MAVSDGVFQIKKNTQNLFPEIILKELGTVKGDTLDFDFMLFCLSLVNKTYLKVLFSYNLYF